MRKSSVPVVIVAVGLLGLGLLNGVLPAAAVTYAPGVDVGDSWTFGDFGCVGICGLENITSVMLEVTSVSGPVVTVTQTVTYNNATVTPSVVMSNVETGEGNGSIFIIARDLNVGDPIFSMPGFFFPGVETFNATIARIVAGSVREVNVIGFSFSAPGFSEGLNLAWDKATGILVELQVTTPDGIGTARVTETSLWSPSSVADITITAVPLTIIGLLGAPGDFTINVTSVNGFAGTVDLSLSPPPPGLTTSISDNILTLGAGQSKYSTLTASAATNGTFVMTVEANAPSQSVARYAVVTFDVQPHFTLDVSPASIAVPMGIDGNATAVLTSVNNFSGTVMMFAYSVPYGLDVSLNTTLVELSPSSSVNVALTVNSATQGEFDVYLSAFSEDKYATAVVHVTVTGPPDFTLSPTLVGLTISRGSAGPSTISIVSLSNYAGEVFLSTSIEPSVVHGPTATLSDSSVTLTPNSTRTVTLTVSTTSLTPAPQFFTVTVNGTDNVTSHDTAVYVYVTRVTPTLTTSLSATTVTPGDRVKDSAVLAGSTLTANGTVTYTLWRYGDCFSGVPDIVSVVTVTNGIVPDSRPVLFNSTDVGQAFSWDAFYSGDSDNEPAFSGCEGPLVVMERPTPTVASTIVNSDGGPVSSVIVGTAIHDSAILSSESASITGTVTYNFYDNNSCSGAPLSTELVTVGAGNAVPDSSPVTPLPGSYSFQAVYSGDANNNGATSSCEPLTVNKATPTITTTIHDTGHHSVTSVVLGVAVHDNAVVSGGFSPTGTVTFSQFATSDCTGTVATETVELGAESQSSTASAAGSISYRATYNGDANNNDATSACESLTVLKASPTIAIALHDPPHAAVTTVTVGTAVHDNGLVSGGFSPTGTVTFDRFNNGACTGTPIESETVALGTESSATTLSPAGSYSYRARYNGDGNNNAATSDCQAITVASAPDFSITGSDRVDLTVGSSGSAAISVSSAYGFTGTVTLTVTVSPTPGLTCETLAPVTGTGTRTLTCSGTVPGTYTVTVSGEGGSFSHQKTITYQVSQVPQSSEQPILGLPPVAFYALIAVATAIVVAAGVFVIRRKRK